MQPTTRLIALAGERLAGMMRTSDAKKSQERIARELRGRRSWDWNKDAC